MKQMITNPKEKKIPFQSDEGLGGNNREKKWKELLPGR